MYVVDSHCDSIQQVDVRNHPLVNPYNMSQKYNQLQMVAMFCCWPHETPAECYKRASRYMGLFSICMDNESDKIVKVKTYADIEKAFAEGKHAALLAIEGGSGIMGDPKIFREFYNFGVRVFGLAWLHNDLAKSNKLEEGEVDTGLTDKGREIVALGNELGTIFDVSHLSDKAFWDVIELAKKPVIATHSNFRDVCNHSRNLTKDMAKALIDKGGVIGLNFYPKIISENVEDHTMEGLFKHLDYCLENFGEDNIGFGGDIDGTTGRFPRDFDLSYSIHDQLIEYLQKHYDERIVEKVAGKNYLEFLKKNL
ncbi:MAG: membrane dipeptidase [Clostridia bacterium]|nr:membrane dipeptidase [Clostridia bacterium]